MKKKDLFIIGAAASARQASWVFQNHYNIRNYVVDDIYLSSSSSICGIDVISLSDFLDSCHEPESFDIFIAIGYQGLNQIRFKKFNFFLNKNYKIINCIDKFSILKSDPIPCSNTMISSGSVIDIGCKLGQNLSIKSNVTISHDASIGDNVFLANGATLGGNVSIGENSFLGLGVVVNPGIEIAKNCLIGSGSIVTKNTEEGYIYIGSPAKKFKKL